MMDISKESVYNASEIVLTNIDKHKIHTIKYYVEAILGIPHDVNHGILWK